MQKFRLSQVIPTLDRGVNKSDTLVSPILKERFQAAVRRLYSDTNVTSTFNTSFGDSETAIVDPSLFPLSFGTSRVLDSSTLELQECLSKYGKSRSQHRVSDEDAALVGRGCYAIDNAWSVRYQWLPCDVRFDHEKKGFPQYVFCHDAL